MLLTHALLTHTPPRCPPGHGDIYPSLLGSGMLGRFLLLLLTHTLLTHTLLTHTPPRCPPGHGDIYPSLLGSGMLGRFLEAGIKYLFVSNSDNLGGLSIHLMH